jgi:hypothetical protein
LIKELPAGFSLDAFATCVRTGDGNVQTFPKVSQEEALALVKDEVNAEYDKEKSVATKTFAWSILLVAAVSIAAGFVMYGVFAALGWAIAGFAKETGSIPRER